MTASIAFSVVSAFLAFLTLVFILFMKGSIDDMKKQLSGLMPRGECEAHHAGQEKLNKEEQTNIHSRLNEVKTEVNGYGKRLDAHIATH